MIKLFSHYLPTKLLVLFGFEAVLLAASIYMGAAIRFYDPVHHLYALPEDLGWQALSFSSVMLMIMATFGLYSADSPEGAKGMIIRLAIAFLVGWGVMSLVFYLI